MKQKILSTILSIFCLVFNCIAQINTPSTATKPFGSNTSYEYGIMPTNLPTIGTYGLATEVGTIYNNWKITFVENCGNDKARIRYDNVSETVSEGIAYGMLLAVYAADKDLFDRLLAYYKQHRNVNGIMNWKISGCNSVIGQGGAADAELDAAMALIIASKQWPTNTSPHNYKTDGVALVNAIRLYEVNKDGTFENGDFWKPACRNPSYQAPAYAKAFKLFMAENGQNQNAFWENVSAKTEDLFANNAHPTSGLSTNWCTPQGSSSSNCSGSGTAHDKFGYDACRAPWRQGVDVLWWGTSATSQVQDVINRQADFWIKRGGANVVQGSDKMNHDGTGSGDHNGAFTGPIGAMSLGVDSNAARQNFANALYTRNKSSQMGNGYFTTILQMIGLFVQTGNFWNPYATTDQTPNTRPIISLTLPANNASFAIGATVNLSADASDADGNIKTVEFYNGNVKLGETSTSPYTYTLENVAEGFYTLMAVATDNGGAIVTSAPLVIKVGNPDINLINNGEFDNETTGWALQLNNSTTGTMTQSTTAAMSGTNSLRICPTSAGNANWNVQASQKVGIVNGNTYEISFLAKADANRTITTSVQQAADPYSTYFSENVNLTNASQLFTYKFTASVTDASALIKFFVGNNTTCVNIDKVVLKENPLSVINNEFEMQELKVFPNPSATGVFQLNIDVNWTVYDFTGYEISKGTTAHIDLSMFSEGLFLLKCNNKVYKLIK